MKAVIATWNATTPQWLSHSPGAELDTELDSVVVE